ncbi:MAG TPA: hypothetical protein VFN52_01450 [Acidiferrobacteraceae bacterium]|nr:hypothetical protein [Acidiferrobacteraceae bacterium]
MENQVANEGAAELREMASLWRSAKDALSDDIVARLGATVGESLDLLDQLNRAQISRLVPLLSEMAEHGDLEKLAALARLVGALQDALSDDIVTRLGALAADGMVVLEQVLQQGVPEAVLGALAEAREEQSRLRPARGGVGGLWDLLKDPEVQDTLRFLLLFGSRLRRRLAR